MDVFAEGSGTRQRLGTVNPETVSQFVIPPAMVVNGLVEFVAELGIPNSAPVRSGTLRLKNGDVVEFEIMAHLTGSSATVHER